jgi:hypothetical protein
LEALASSWFESSRPSVLLLQLKLGSFARLTLLVWCLHRSMVPVLAATAYTAVTLSEVAPVTHANQSYARYVEHDSKRYVLPMLFQMYR